MTARAFLIIALFALVAVAGAAMTLLGRAPLRAEAEVGAPLLPGLAERSGTVAEIAVRGPLGGVTLTRGTAGWTVKERDGYPAVPGKVRETIVGLAEATLFEAKTARPERYAALDLAEPGQGGAGAGRSVELRTGAGETVAALTVGKRRLDLGGDGEGTYVRRQGEGQTWLVRLAADPEPDPAGWVAPDVVDIAAARVVRLTIRHPDGTALTVTRPAPEALATVEGLPADAKLKGQPAVDAVLGALAGVYLEDVRAAAGLALPAEQATRIEVATGEGLALSLALFNLAGDWWATIAATAPEGGEAAKEAYSIRARTGGWAYKLPPYKAAALNTRLADLLAKEAPAP